MLTLFFFADVNLANILAGGILTNEDMQRVVKDWLALVISNGSQYQVAVDFSS